MSHMPATLPSQILGHPIDFWIDLKRDIELKGRDFDRILVDALMERHELQRQLDKAKADWDAIQKLIRQHTERHT